MDNLLVTKCHEPIDARCDDFEHPCRCHQYKNPCTTCRKYDEELQGEPAPQQLPKDKKEVKYIYD